MTLSNSHLRTDDPEPFKHLPWEGLQPSSPTLGLGTVGSIACLVVTCLALPVNIAALILSIRQFGTAVAGPSSTLALLDASHALADLLTSLLTLFLLAWLQPTGALLPTAPCLLLSPALALLAFLCLPTPLYAAVSLLAPAHLHTRGRLPLTLLPWALSLLIGLAILLYVALTSSAHHCTPTFLASLLQLHVPLHLVSATGCLLPLFGMYLASLVHSRVSPISCSSRPRQCDQCTAPPSAIEQPCDHPSPPSHSLPSLLSSLNLLSSPLVPLSARLLNTTHANSHPITSPRSPSPPSWNSPPPPLPLDSSSSPSPSLSYSSNILQIVNEPTGQKLEGTLCSGSRGIVWVDRRSPDKAQFQGRIFDMLFTSKTEPPGERRQRRSSSLKVAHTEEPTSTPARVRSAGDVLHREQTGEVQVDLEKIKRKEKSRERKKESEKFWRRFQKDMFESEAERIDVAPREEARYRDVPFYLPAPITRSTTPSTLHAWDVPHHCDPTSLRAPLYSFLATLPALLALLLYLPGLLGAGPATMALLSPAAIHPCLTIVKIQMDKSVARARKALNIVV